MEGTLGALDTAVKQGKALFVGVSPYSAERTGEAARILARLGTPLVIHQPSYSLLNRWIEDDLIDLLGGGGDRVRRLLAARAGPSDRPLPRVPVGSRAGRPSSLRSAHLSEENLAKVRALHAIAAGRNQTLAQMALAWTLRDERVASTLIGASSVAQLDDNVAALRDLAFTQDELVEIDRHATESGVDLWAASGNA